VQRVPTEYIARMTVLDETGYSEPSRPRGMALPEESLRHESAHPEEEVAETGDMLDGVALAEATMHATNTRFAHAGMEAVDRQAIVDAMPHISFVATGVVGFEPADEPQWAKEFFSDIYWQRHSNLRRSQISVSKSITTLLHRPAFR